MRVIAGTVFAFFFGGYVLAQQPGAGPQSSAMAAPAVIASPSQLAALVATLKSELKKDQAGITRPLLSSPLHTVVVEHRVGPSTPGSHEMTSEFYYIVEGAGTSVTGGRIVGSNPGTVEGGAARQVSAGDVVLVPEGTPHYFSAVDGSITFLIVRMPRPPQK